MNQRLFTFFFVSLLWLVAARATVTIEFSFGELAVANGTVGILVADVDQDGFTSLLDGAGTVLAVGSTISGSDDKIIATIQADDGAHWDGARGFSDTLSAIDYAALGISENTPLQFCWFPGHQLPGETLVRGDSWSCFQTSDIGTSGGTIGFLAPAERGSYRISHLSAAFDGDFDPLDPGATGNYASGMVGTPLPAPTNLTATDGTHPDKVVLSWDALSGAQGYRVFRSTGNDFSSASELTQLATNSFEDSSGEFGVSYFYWVLGYDELGNGEESLPATGSRDIAAVEGLVATQGSSASAVDLSWNVHSNATSYDVFRNTEDSFATSSLLINTASNSYSDTTVGDGVAYYYWVVAKQGGNSSEPGVSDAGWKAMGSVTGLVASTGEFAGRVFLSWESVAGATVYKIYRSSTDDFSGAEYLGDTGEVQFDDLSAGPLTEYYYWVEATNGQIAGPAGESGAPGRRGDVRPDLTIGSKSSQKKGNNIYNSSASGQKITEKSKRRSRITSYSFLQNDTAADDGMVVSGSKGNRYFKVKYLRKSPTSGNITSAIKTGRYYSTSLSTETQESIQIQLKPTAKAKDRKKSYSLILKAYAESNSSQKDAVKVKAKHKP